MRAAWILLALAAALARAQAPPALAPLTAREIRAAAKILRDSGRMPADAIFSQLTLQEPPKEAVLRGAPAARRAFAVIYTPSTNRTSEAIAYLSSGRVA